MKRRRLSAEDRALWDMVTAKTERLDRSNLEVPKFDQDARLPSTDEKSLRKASSTIIGKPESKRRAPSHDLVPSIPDRLRKAPVQMDQKSFGKLKRGKLKPEGRIDLHGMTLERAHPALTNFIMTAHARGKRLVLVITGKGKQRDEGGPIPVRHGVLRHQVPQWLSMQPMASVVLQVAQAHISHGGGGAYYIYLRRQR